MQKSLLLIPFILLSCGKGGSDLPKTEINEVIELETRDEVKYSSKFLDEDIYYTLNTKGPLPKMDDSRYINVKISHDKDLKEFNYTNYPEGTKTIKITALDLKLGSSKTHSVYNLIKNTFDVKKLIIIARKVEVLGPIHIAGGDVEIRAEEVHFQGSGLIKTTPVTKSELPKTFEDGVNGLNGGEIKIIANAIVRKYPKTLPSGEEAPFLITTGGDGQAAGPGLDGARGENAHLVSDQKVYLYEYEICERPHHRHKSAIDLQSTFGCYWKKSEGKPSKNGEDAKVGGTPGMGGKPGQVFLSQEFTSGVLGESGKSGAADRERVGGLAGTPNKVCKYKRAHREKGYFYDCIETKNGKTVIAKKAITPFEKASVKVLEESFLTPDYLGMLNTYATDVYKENHIEIASSLYKSIEEESSKMLLTNFETFMLKESVSTSLVKIDSHKDFYGNEKVWTPNIAFEVSYKVFENEMKNNIKNIYIVRSLMDKNKSLEEKKTELLDLSEELYKGITFQRDSITNSVLKSNAILTAKEDLEVSEKEFQYELNKLEEKIRKEAKRSLETPFLNQALKVVSVASKCIPVGQPVFAAIGVAADLLDKATTKGAKASDIIKELPNTAKAFDNLDWQKATSELDKKLNDLDPSVFANAKSNKERLAYLKELKDFANPIYKAVSEQVRAFKDQEVSASKLEKAIAEIKRKDARFQKVLKSLDQLLEKKKHFVKVMQDYNLKMTSSLDQITKSYVQMAQISSDNLELITFENSELESILKEIEKNAFERLSYYHYLFSKSYEYRMLTPYSKTFSYEKLVNQIMMMQTLNTSKESNVDELLIFYKRELSDIVYKAITDLENVGLSHKMSEVISLTNDQEQALNNGEVIYLDLRKFYSEDKKDIRLNSVRLLGGFNLSGVESSIELKVQHSGTSLLNNNGKTYIFNHSDLNQPNLTWFSSVGVGGHELSYSELSIQENSLFVEMLGISERTKLLTQPGGRTFISLKLRKHSETQINNLRLELDYSFKL